MAPAAATGGSTLPSGFSVFTTLPDLLFIFEFVFSYIATLLYVVHAVFSLIRWKSS
ncbi:mal, T cell differentiation protein [Homo sapiens]|uniref:Isoform D of Myelin and lymphocyte protein n=1 Tax=Homo sapiens TaxID=9606 RepID=P21145-4|nr:myelin and lymphocyte protein isoform d [Homo sapiens]KAI2524274.1 mal, T cell differentiation protein [Homo sapiens]KAI4035424.1 mal, T cell differentiation protein [Homo sapiens]CAA54103.1 MAL-dex [Homo sapiens]|eukprot:NP_071885.1 myelin and lymphocyte protein isoform d [Homo sapiens]